MSYSKKIKKLKTGIVFIVLIVSVGYFACFAYAGDVSKAFAFPVPFRPSDNEIRFTGISGECTINVYTMAGELVKTIEHTDGNPFEDWDVTSDSGNPVFSGIYTYYIEAKDSSNRGKLMVIR